jgi:SM-20-related protein
MLEETFETIISSFLENKVGLINDFLNEDLSSHLIENLLLLLQEKQLKMAGVGNNSKLLNNKSIRGDVIYWLDRKHENVHENRFLDIIDEFVKYLNRTCYSGITGYEFHYAFYEKGSFYKRHLDQFRNNQNRAFSMIMYLNDDWKVGNGGELCIYHNDHTQIISPTNGKCVFFKSSELEHEVLLSHQPRMSITGWLKTN